MGIRQDSINREHCVFYEAYEVTSSPDLLMLLSDIIKSMDFIKRDSDLHL